jgi:hypothetical protein
LIQKEYLRIEGNIFPSFFFPLTKHSSTWKTLLKKERKVILPKSLHNEKEILFFFPFSSYFTTQNFSSSLLFP